jgi:hypothetical protein
MIGNVFRAVLRALIASMSVSLFRPGSIRIFN